MNVPPVKSGAPVLPVGGHAEIAIARIATGGDGVGRLPDGRVVLVPFVAPGERAIVEIVSSEARLARARLVRLVQTSPRRVTPRCALFGACGGCTLQHLAPVAQLEAKEQIVRDHLVRPGHVVAESVRPIRASAEVFGYRQRMRFHSKGGRLGLFRHESTELVETLACPIASEAIEALLPALSRVVAEHSRDVRAELEIVDEDGALAMSLHAVAPPDVDLEPVARALAELPTVHRVLARSQRGVTSLGPEGSSTEPPPGSFRQAHRDANRILREVVAAAVGEGRGEVLELYAGSGNLSFAIADRGHPVVAVENDRESVLAGQRAVRRFLEVPHASGQRGADVRFVHASVAPFLHRDPRRAEIVVMNPPRTGLPAKTAPSLARRGARKLVYVSCNPATLGRDLARLHDAGFDTREVAPIDLFPQTAHVECVVTLVGR